MPMETQHKSIFLLLLALLLSIPLSAQKMTVESMVHTPLDQTANLSENIVYDFNGVACGVVKVMLAASGATFGGGWVKQEKLYRPSEYWVWMAKGADNLQVNVPGYLPLKVNFRDYENCIIQSLHTYVLTITLPVIGDGPVDDGMRYLAMTVEPKNSTVLVDGNPQVVDVNGEVSVLLPKGSHSYQVLAPGYATKEGTVELGDDNKPLSIILSSTQATLRVECATKGAVVFVNGQQKGTVPWSGTLSEGSYQVEARLAGYRSQKQSITVAQKENRTLTIPALQMIAGRLNVDCRPIGSDVYVDGKKVGTTPNIFRNIPVGNRSVEIRKDGYEPLRKTIEIKENEQSTLTGALTAVSNSASSSSSTNSSSSSSNKETFSVNGVSFTMIRVDGGTFTMGATAEQGSDAESDEKPAHEVTLSTYMIGETEVTQALWQAVMGGNPSSFMDSPQNPVESISWKDCQKFIKKLNSLTGKSFRLPTEAEWEFAARGGNKSKHSKYSGSGTIDDVAWYTENSGGKTHPVKSKSPNELGIYDMSGNVFEWCEDWHDSDYYKSSPKSNPTGPSSGSFRVLRGGSCFNYSRYCRVSNRGGSTPGRRGIDLGLRLAL